MFDSSLKLWLVWLHYGNFLTPLFNCHSSDVTKKLLGQLLDASRSWMFVSALPETKKIQR